jgi:hypothetical protein
MDCRDSLDILGHLPKKKKRTALGQFLQAAEEVWHENTPGGGGHVHTISAYARTLSRGPTDIPISDAIVPLRDGRAEFSAVFAGVREGTYLVDLFAVDPTGKAACLDVPTPQELHWKWDQRTMLTPNSIRAGVYELFLCQRLGERVLRRESAIVLVANGKRWANRMRAEYQKIQQADGGLGPAGGFHAPAHLLAPLGPQGEPVISMPAQTLKAPWRSRSCDRTGNLGRRSSASAFWACYSS